jgi:arsenate reductase
MEIWINPECSKCKTALEVLDEAGATYTVRRYLDEPPTAGEIEAVLERLGLEPWQITRSHEAVAKRLGLATLARDETTRARWIELLAENPVLIQRPIITADDGSALVARSETAVRTALDRR